MASPYGSPVRAARSPIDGHPSPLPSSSRTPAALASPYDSPHARGGRGAAGLSPVAASPTWTPQAGSSVVGSPARGGSRPPALEPYVPVFDRRTLFAQQPQRTDQMQDVHVTPSPSPARLRRLQSPSGVGASYASGASYGYAPASPSQQPIPASPQMQAAVNDVANSRFASFIPISPHPTTNEPMSVLVFDDAHVHVSSPQQQVLGIHPMTGQRATTSFPAVGNEHHHQSHIYTFEEKETNEQASGSIRRPPPTAESAGQSSTAPTPFAASPSDGPARVSFAPSTSMQVAPLDTLDPDGITIKIGGCWDLDPQHLLIGGVALLALMLLFTCIAFGVSWTTATAIDGATTTFFITRFNEDVHGLANRTDYSADYSSATDYRNQCAIDDQRIYACLGLSLPLLFIAAFCMRKRSDKGHSSVKWRRLTILTLVIYGFLCFLSCVFWWQGCWNVAKVAASTTSATPLNSSVRFTGGWWLTMVNLFFTIILIGVQSMAYGDQQCCVCAC